jgi:hypothetical protein
VSGPISPSRAGATGSACRAAGAEGASVWYRVACCALALTFAACSLETAFVPPTPWQATLEPLEEELVDGAFTGSVAAIVQGQNTEAEISFHGDPSTTYSWSIAEGSCLVPGRRVGGAAAWPEFTTNASGGGIQRGVSPELLRTSRQYHASVSVMDGDDEVTVSCGSLELWSAS